MRRLLIAFVLGSVAVAAIAFIALKPAAGAAGCSTPWGSTAENRSTYVEGPITGVRAGRHTCFDRFVIDLRGPASGYSVQYVPVVTSDGSGHAVPVLGGAAIQVIVRAPAPRATVPSVGGFSTFRQVKWAGSFEGSTTYALGVRARLPFRVLSLSRSDGTSFVAVDVAHRW
jgi:hypothetical protein